MPGSPTHYLRHNLQNRQPRRHIFLDTEADVTYDPDHSQQEQSWRLGVARYVDADPRRKAPAVTDVDYRGLGPLWRDVSAFTRRGSRTLLWAHNLAYDLRISQGLIALPQLGWSLEAIVLDGQSCWARFKMDDRTLIMCDFTSWASIPLARIGGLINLPQVLFPADATDERSLFERCRRDVEILSEAVMSTLQWVESNDMGNLQITGTGQAWNCFRHRFLNERILVHDHPVARMMERKAIWTGRTEAFRHGRITTPTWEYDLPRAYATIARDVTLPTVWQGWLPRLSVEKFKALTSTRSMLSDCVIETTKPIVPSFRNGGGIFWPVGKFRSTLWDCEISALLQHDSGARVRLYRTQVYTRTPCLRDWAAWILARLAPLAEGDAHPDTPLQRVILKQWSRSLIGRFALQYRSWEPMGTADTSDLWVSELTGPGVGSNGQLMQVGHDILELGKLTESENSLPQLTGYITAMCRVRLYDLMCSAGHANVLYTDTDSLIVNAAGRRNLEARIAADGAYGLVLKHEIDDLDLQGPRQLTVNGERRFSGVPKKAQPAGNGEVLGEVWEGLGEALRNGRSGKVLVHERKFELKGQRDRRREWMPDGSTRPLHVTF